MLGPHIFGGCPVTSRNSLDSCWLSASCCPVAFFFRKSATLTFVGLVLFSATAISLPERQPCLLQRAPQFDAAIGAHAVQGSHFGLALLRQFRECREPRPLQCAPRRRGQPGHESIGRPFRGLAGGTGGAIRALVEHVSRAHTLRSF